MCGICGFYNFDGTPADLRLLAQMKDALSHRGPDGEGEFACGEVGLGHRRLSIIDLGGGGQPIGNEDGTIQTVFNGEIYNYVELREELKAYGHIFRTQTDTEVIVHAYEQWATDCVTKFNGIFAFALWDARARRLFIARDHLGVKPLYYVTVNNALLFGSEIKALLVHDACPRQVDLESLGQLFSLRYVVSPNTLFDGIKKLPPAHYMTVTKSGAVIKRYWNWTPQPDSSKKETDLIEEYRFLVEDAVKLQMRSDVPVGLFLSSGVDSGALLALMSRHSPKRVRTFTIGFENGDGENETADARAMASQFQADHSEMIIGPQDYETYYERYMGDLEEPVGNETAAAFYFVSLIASQKVKVALTGQGADEPWAGYSRYTGAKLAAVYSRLPSAVTEGLLRPIIARLPRNERLKRGTIALTERDPLQRLVKIYSFYDSDMKQRLFQPWLKKHLSVDGVEARRALSPLYRDVAEADTLSQMLYMDTRTNLPDDLLMVGDKTSMANSLEARVPFLDYRLVQFVETLPSSLKLRGLQHKYLHKKALTKWVAKDVVYRKKKGFANPVHKWLRTRMRRYVHDCLMTSTARVRQYFNSDYIGELLRGHESGEQAYLRHIYLLLSFELWHRRFINA